MGDEMSTTPTTGTVCTGDDFEVLGQCYHQTELTEIAVAVEVAAGDFDGDQSLDLAMRCRTANGGTEPFSLCVTTLDGSTVLREEVDWWSTGSGEIHAADFDADGRADVLVSEYYRFAVFSLVDGAIVERSSSFQDSDSQPGFDPFRFPALPIDVDQDGRAEVVAGRSGFFQGIQLWRFTAEQDGWIPVGEPLPLFGCGDVADAEVADLDGDGRPELLAIGSHNNCDEDNAPSSGWNRVSVFTSDANSGLLVPLNDFAAELPASRLAVGAFDSDGVPDVVVASTDVMMVFRGHGDGTFADPIPMHGVARFIGTGPRAGDYDGDGVDEITAEQDDGGYSVLAGIPAPEVVALPGSMLGVQLVADLNDDGHADIVSIASDEYYAVVSLSVP